MRAPVRARTIRDPVWQNIDLDPVAAAIVEAPEFQRLRRVKQLGFAHLVYPGAVHTRFLHALGVYHLTRRAIAFLTGPDHARCKLEPEDLATVPLLPLAALLHDVGHYAFSHAMEELETQAIPGHHEEMASRFLDTPAIREPLERVHSDALPMVADLIRGQSSHPLQGLISGSLDLDKIDYLRRDSFFCGVPYGAVDVERLLHSLTLAEEHEGKGLEVAVTEKGISALESLLFAKYQMFRNVYWHHGVRAATVTFRRLVESALETGALESEDLPGRTDEELLGLIGNRSQDEADSSVTRVLLRALADRRLPKRTIELLADEIPATMASWIPERRDLVRKVEDSLAERWGQAPGTVFLDYPVNPNMLELQILLVSRHGEVRRLTSAGEEGLIDLPRLSRSLHHTTRGLRVFTLERLDSVDPGPLLDLLVMTEKEVRGRLARGEPLLAG
ncbi:MAG: HD domain-containing protein [Gemmatimonadota bacterium]